MKQLTQEQIDPFLLDGDGLHLVHWRQVAWEKGPVICSLTRAGGRRDGMVASRVARTILILITVCFVRAAQAQYSGGAGEPNDPYQIATAEDLMLLGETPEDYDRNFILTADIDLDPNLPGRKIFDKVPIGYFKGILDGNGKSILHLTTEGGPHLGLVGRLGAGAEIRNIRVVGASIAGTGSVVGVLVGYNRGCLTNCYASGTVSSTGSSVGGLVGENFGIVNQCHSAAGVGSARSYGAVGGLVGENLGHVTACYSTGTISGVSHVGGLAGINGGRVGILGKGPGTISDCYSTGRVIAPEGIVGGLVGANVAGNVTRCYSTGAVIGNQDTGGLVGSNRDTVTQCFWDIQTSGLTTSAGGTGKNSEQMKSTGTFLIWGTCGNEGTWTIDEGDDYPALWWENREAEPIVLGSSLSELLSGDGLESSPYLIYTGEQLNLVGLFPCDWDKHFKLMADIDLSGFDGKAGRPAFNIIGSSSKSRAGVPFTGVFDGNGHTVANFTYTPQEDRGNIGLFGFIADPNALVRNVGLIDPNVDGGSEGGVGSLAGFLEDGRVTGCHVEGCSVKGGVRVGGLAGESWHGSVTASSSSGIITAKVGRVGGLVGANWYGSITTSCSTCAVNGDIAVGGLVGFNCYGDITASYSAGPVTGDTDVGGLAGDNSGGIASSFSSGLVTGKEYVGGIAGWGSPADVTCSVWDMQTSLQSASAGGVGLTTAQMQTAATFLDSGWDFVEETANGTEDIWWILEGQDYPRLWWEKTGN
ncbi:MAG: GLUG motif-containing protein [Planctomycetota bacterium]